MSRGRCTQGESTPGDAEIAGRVGDPSRPTAALGGGRNARVDAARQEATFGCVAVSPLRRAGGVGSEPQSSQSSR